MRIYIPWTVARYVALIAAAIVASYVGATTGIYWVWAIIPLASLHGYAAGRQAK